MTADELSEVINQVRTTETEVDRAVALSALETKLVTLIETSEQTAAEAMKYKEERDKYAKLNNELWLKKPATIVGGSTPTDTAPAVKRSFTDLKFD